MIVTSEWQSRHDKLAEHAYWRQFSTADLLHQRYLSGIAARNHADPSGAREVQAINGVLAWRGRSYL